MMRSIKIPCYSLLVGCLILAIESFPIGSWAEDFHQTTIVDTPIKEPVWSADQKSHWAFQKIKKVDPPNVKNKNQVRNEIDRFIFSQIESLGFATSVESAKETLIRRVTFDLTGLPPTPSEIDAFLADQRPDAYERLVDDLLDRKTYGERWARWWLDLARYAESDGFKADDIRPNAWRYRDWVVKAMNEDMPYDRFISLQLAGDELEPNDPDSFIATGLNRLYPFESNNMVPGHNRQLILDDITDTNAALFIGLTVACARCHDHKYDPISQKDYYRFEALFGGLHAKDDFPIGNAMEVAVNTSVNQELATRKDLLQKSMSALEQGYWSTVLEPMEKKLAAATKKSLETPADKRTGAEITTIRNAMKALKVSTEQIVTSMKPADRNAWNSMKSGLDTMDKAAPDTLPVAIGMTDTGPVAQPVRLLIKGNFHVQAEVVPPGFLSVLSDQKIINPAPTGHSTTGTRTELAKWLTSPDHPLTSRVLVNRLWQQHFGRGIVGTTSDFGTQGMEPTHPELLDWLASRMMQSKWSLKQMHRLMVTSATYRFSSQPTEQARSEDPDNLLFSHQFRRRLDAEMVRDSVLAVAGTLNRTYGGPSVRPALPDGIKATDWKTDEDKSKHLRRSIYIFAQRNVRLPFLEAFDLPDSNLSCPERLISVNAPQALMLLNSDFVEEQSGATAERLLNQTRNYSEDDRLKYLWQLCLGRKPTEQELKRLQLLVAELRANQESTTDASKSVPESWSPEANEKAVWANVCHVVLNLNEFLFVD